MMLTSHGCGLTLFSTTAWEAGLREFVRGICGISRLTCCEWTAGIRLAAGMPRMDVIYGVFDRCNELSSDRWTIRVQPRSSFQHSRFPIPILYFVLCCIAPPIFYRFLFTQKILTSPFCAPLFHKWKSVSPEIVTAFDPYVASRYRIGLDLCYSSCHDRNSSLKYPHATDIIFNSRFSFPRGKS